MSKHALTAALARVARGLEHLASGNSHQPPQGLLYKEWQRSLEVLRKRWTDGRSIRPDNFYIRSDGVGVCTFADGETEHLQATVEFWQAGLDDGFAECKRQSKKGLIEPS